jgi:hypothetical protein
VATPHAASRDVQVRLYRRGTVEPTTRFLSRIVVLFTASIVYACGPVQLISEQSVEDKLANIRLGVTTKAEIENLFGTEHGAENLRWVYNLSTRPTNTQALITVRFSGSGTVKGLEVARYFNPPFTNDYWYMIEGRPENILELAARAGETSGFRVLGVDKSANGFALEDSSSKARITLQLEKATLHISSSNPYNRLANEYRVFTKREGVFIEKLLDALAKPAALTKPVASTEGHSRPAKKTAHLSWNNSSPNADGFRIYRITGNQRIKIADLRPNITTYIDNDAPPKACYVVTAFNAAGESPPTSKVCLPD